MSFLQPALLWALPLITLPVLIHLMQRRRPETVGWAAMSFLLSATALPSGYSRIRQWVVLALRTLAFAGLILAISRPLASNWLQLAMPARVDLTLILLDCSPSMQQRESATGPTKMQSIREQLAGVMNNMPSHRWVVIDSANRVPIEISSIAELDRIAEVEGVSSSADIPGMLQAAYNFLQSQQSARTEVWLCSDARKQDWQPEDTRWQGLREAFQKYPLAIRFHLLLYPAPPRQNRSIRITSAHTRAASQGRELLLSMAIQRSDASHQEEIPVRLEWNEVATEIRVAAAGATTEVIDHVIPLPHGLSQSWGRVVLPQDENQADNEYFFVHQDSLPRRTLIVTEHLSAARAWEVAAEVQEETGDTSHVEIHEPGAAGGADWEAVSLVIWQAALPDEPVATLLRTVAEQGTRIVFLPPAGAGGTAFAGLSWGDWQVPRGGTRVNRWVKDHDLLANVRSGSPLPLEDLLISRYRQIRGEMTPLAMLSTEGPLLCRGLTNQANIYFLATTTSPLDSTLEQNGVVLFVLLQRALAAGSLSQGTTHDATAGSVATEAATHWTKLNKSERSVSTNPAHTAGVYAQGDKQFAVNRSLAEDATTQLDPAAIDHLFAGLHYDRLDRQAADRSEIFQELWSTCLLLMLIALLAESAVCLPRQPARPLRASQASDFPSATRRATS
ncbi:MAG: BatA domain-containing protein [Planctomycetaceae bacterium]|nr:BatA domain-containing protein [Planctomycetaceae bacterium]